MKKFIIIVCFALIGMFSYAYEVEANNGELRESEATITLVSRDGDDLNLGEDEETSQGEGNHNSDASESDEGGSTGNINLPDTGQHQRIVFSLIGVALLILAVVVSLSLFIRKQSADRIVKKTAEKSMYESN